MAAGGSGGDDAAAAGAAELAFGTDNERHVGAVLILPEHRVETHVLLDDGGGGGGEVGGTGADDATGGLSKLSLLDNPPPGINMII